VRFEPVFLHPLEFDQCTLGATKWFRKRHPSPLDVVKRVFEHETRQTIGCICTMMVIEGRSKPCHCQKCDKIELEGSTGPYRLAECISNEYSQDRRHSDDDRRHNIVGTQRRISHVKNGIAWLIHNWKRNGWRTSLNPQVANGEVDGVGQSDLAASVC
jgi:hypothetical protein